MSLTDELQRPQRRTSVAPAAGYALSLLLVSATTLAAVIVDQLADIPNLSLIFVLPVVICAVSVGWGPSLLAALAGVTAFNFFLIAPRYTFHVADPANVLALALLLVTAAIVSAVAAQSRRRALQAWEAADQAAALQALARTLVGSADRAAIARASAEALARLFSAPAAVFLEADEDLRPPALAGGAALSAADEEAARWALASRLPTRGGAYPVEAAAYDFWPVAARHGSHAVIGVRLSGRDDGRPASPERLVEVVGGYLSVALERETLAAQAMETRVEMAGERLKADLLAAVSHDLKTPLSTVLFTLQSLQKFDGAHDAKTRAELLALAEAETARLSAMVGNLLDMNRLQAGGVAVRTAPVTPAELVVEALGRAAQALAGRRVVNEVKTAAAPLMVDASLFESALGNVLENAGKYAPAGSTIRVRAGADDDAGWIEVLDEGPGLPEPVERLFEKFTRGVSGDGRPPGTGLGLAIARGFLEAQGGRVEAGNRADGPGARVRLSAPLATTSLERA
ncbi:MAG: hypothetical protein JWQ46_182 [Phenylobacterium sp.]|nr:hypothetical protein [Phenylobacterium sp.]